MAQAIFDDSTQTAIRRELAQQRAASQATQQRAASNLPGRAPTAAGTVVNDLGTAPSSITQSDIQARAAQLAQQSPTTNTIGSDVPAAARRPLPGTAPSAAGISSTEIDPASLSASERAAFARQGARITDQVPPTAPSATGGVAPPTPDVAAPSPSAPAAGAGSTPRGLIARTASGIAGGAGNLVRGVVESPFTPAGLAVQTTASAYNSFNRPTEDYANRFGVDTPDSLAGNLALRTAGVFTDLGANVLDLGVHGVNAVRHVAGAAPLQSFSSIIQAQDNPEAAVRARNDASAANGADMTSLPPTNANFSNVQTNDVRSTAPVTGIQGGIAALPGAVDSRGNPMGYGKMVSGLIDPQTGKPTGAVPTYSDGSGNPNAKGYVPRTMTNAEIAGLANGNRISIADAGIGGNIASEANGGKTLELGEGPTTRRNTGFTAADRQAQGAAIEKQGNTYEFNRLMQKSQTELARGNRKTATILAGLATNYGSKIPPEETPGAAALNAAKVTEANANATNSTSEARRRGQESALIDQAQNEPDPNKRQTIYDTILAALGKNSDRVISIKTRDPSGALDSAGQPLMIERPFDARTRQYLDTAR